MNIRPLKIPRAFMGGDFEESGRGSKRSHRKIERQDVPGLEVACPWQSSRGLMDREVDWAGPGVVLQVRLDLNLEAGLVSSFTCLVSC